MGSSDSWDKIRLKGGPKQYKRGPGPTGRHLLARQVAALTTRAYKLLRKSHVGSADSLYAQALYDSLREFAARLQTVLDAE